MLAHGGGVARIGRDAGADGGGAEVDLAEWIDQPLEAGAILAQRDGEAFEFLAQSHGHGILQLRPAHLHNAGKFSALGTEGIFQQLQLGEQALDRKAQAHLQRGRIGVIRALAAIDVIVRIEVLVFAFLMTGQLEAAVGHHLVDVHVGGRCRRRPA